MNWIKINGNRNYSVSPGGDVRNDITGLILKPVKHHTGYLAVSLRINGTVRLTHIHRLVAVAYIPNINDFKVVNHIDGIKTNNAVENLEWCTQVYNEAHAKANGLKASNKGEANGTSVLTFKQVADIRSKYLSGVRQFQLAREFNISTASICNIVNNKSWTIISYRKKELEL